MSEENKDLLMRYHTAWGQGDIPTLLHTLHADYVSIDPVSGEGSGRIREGENCRLWHESFEDTELRVEQIIAEGDRVSVYWTLMGTHTGEYAGVPATGRSVVIPGLEMHRIEDGQIRETWRLTDVWSMMLQLDALNFHPE
ncbi:MAG: ester cyclase [Chloroflexi bacterium]|nr:ester cyclase [Chloroflexota bacterium]